MVQKDVAVVNLSSSLHVGAEAFLVGVPGEVSHEDAGSSGLGGLSRWWASLGVSSLGVFGLAGHFCEGYVLLVSRERTEF